MFVFRWVNLCLPGSSGNLDENGGNDPPSPQNDAIDKNDETDENYENDENDWIDETSVDSTVIIGDNEGTHWKQGHICESALKTRTYNDL